MNRRLVKKLFLLPLLYISIIMFTSSAHCHNWKIINNEEYYCDQCGAYYHGTNPQKEEIVYQSKNENNFSFKALLKTKPFKITLNILFVLLAAFILIAYLRFIYNDSLTYDEERHITNTLSFFIPFVTVFVICVKPLYYGLWILGIPIALIPALTVGMLGMLIGYSINVNRAKHYKLPDNDPSVQNEKLKQKIGFASLFLVGFSLFKHTKRTLKDIQNVDGWKEMK